MKIRDLIEDAKRTALSYREQGLAYVESLLKPSSPVLEEIAVSESSSDILKPKDEVLAAHGSGEFTLYERLGTHPQVFTTMRTRRAEVIAREWIVEPGADDELSKLASDDLKAQLTKLGWDPLTYKMLGGLIPGNGYGECMFALRDDGHVLLNEVRVRPASRWAYRKDGALLLKKKGNFEPVPERKIWTYRAGAEHDDDPYGQGLGPVLYWPCWFQRNGLRFWSVFLERFANPTPKATVPTGTKDEDRAKLIELLGSIMNGGRIVVPRGVDVELIQAIRSSGGDFQVFHEMLDAQIAKVVLGQTMTTDQGSSYAQAQIHYRVMQARAKADADMIDDSFTRGPATWLTEWNYPGATVPRVYREFSLGEDLSARADLDGKLNLIGYRPRAQYIADTYGDNYDYVPPPAPAAPGAFGFAEPLPRDPVGPLVENGGWRRVMQPQVQMLERLLDDVKSLEDFRDRLGEIALDDPHAMTEALARVLFTARIAGNVEAEELDGDG